MQTREYWMPDQGELLASGAGGSPLRLDEAAVVQLVRDNSRGLPVGFILEMIRSETNFAWNEVDTDYDGSGEPREEKTYGLGQLRKSEFAGALSAGALSDSAAVDPAGNVGAFSRVLNNYDSVISALAPGSADYDRLCYIAWAHNNGIGAVTKSINTYGLDWQAAKARPQNDWFTSRLIPYAERAADGASTYPETGTSSDSSLLRVVLLALVGWVVYRVAHGQNPVPV